MKTIVGVRFRKPGKVYFFDPGYIQLNLKDKVVVETTMGEDVGEVVINKRQIPDDKVSTELKRIVRLANNRDLKRVEDNKIKEQKAMKVCKEKIKKHNLDMNLVDVEYKFDNSRTHQNDDSSHKSKGSLFVLLNLKPSAYPLEYNYNGIYLQYPVQYNYRKQSTDDIQYKSNYHRIAHKHKYPVVRIFPSQPVMIQLIQ